MCIEKLFGGRKRQCTVALMVEVKQCKCPFLPESISCCCVSRPCVALIEPQRIAARRACSGDVIMAVVFSCGHLLQAAFSKEDARLHGSSS